jgi:hypothetical protein
MLEQKNVTFWLNVQTKDNYLWKLEDVYLTNGINELIPKTPQMRL